ncbi:MAG: class I SAM-dependent methyltransferase [Labilithrix sp.]|nr:class I SAM-dependent methyltransferase [Labilithrix sp.]
MNEPHLSRFRELIRQGAGTLDIHDGQQGSSYTVEATAYDALIDREVGRVAVHQKSICRLLERHVGRVEDVLDVGCGTGATTVAVALSERLGARHVRGIDPNAQSLEAAAVRARGHDVDETKISFSHVPAGERFPADDGAHDLVLCVSVLEYLYTRESRVTFAEELLRVTRPGGTVCLVTPSPFRLFDFHTHRLLGDWRRVEGYPWASRPSEIRAMFAGHDVRFLKSEQLAHGLSSRGLPSGPFLRPLAPLAALLPWQKVLVTKRSTARGSGAAPPARAS